MASHSDSLEQAVAKYQSMTEIKSGQGPNKVSDREYDKDPLQKKTCSER